MYVFILSFCVHDMTYSNYCQWRFNIVQYLCYVSLYACVCIYSAKHIMMISLIIYFAVAGTYVTGSAKTLHVRIFYTVLQKQL